MSKPTIRRAPMLYSFVILVAAACSGIAVEDAHMQACECGTPEHDVYGCPSGCSTGKACDNPLCTCESDPAAPTSRGSAR